MNQAESAVAHGVRPAHAGIYVNANTVAIRTRPALTTSSREVRTEGLCGTRNDWETTAHGAYATLEEAQSALARIFGEVRDRDSSGDAFTDDIDPDVVAVYTPGKYIPMSSTANAVWIHPGIAEAI